jgi:peptide/nickel transport system ATP-binding protein
MPEAQRAGPAPELLRVDRLTVAINETPIVSDVTFTIYEGETVGIVGESGSGKSITGLALLGLLPAPVRLVRGSISFEGKNLADCSERELRDIRGAGLGMIFQDPVRSLNPGFTVGEQIAEALRWHLKVSRREAWTTSVELLAEVGIRSAAQRARDYPHMFSGGMCQRVMIAMALACRPKILIADEPTTALDVTTQAQILRLIKALQARFSFGVLLISHDLAVVAEVCDHILVMYAGQIVEEGPAEQLMTRPRHPYTESLLRCATGAAVDETHLVTLSGAVPPPGAWPRGCRFNPRCDYVVGKCVSEMPALEVTEGLHNARCHLARELTLEGIAWQRISSK